MIICFTQIQILNDNGGHDMREFVRRNMKYLMRHILARHFNVTGQKGKRAFEPLAMFEALYGMYYNKWFAYGSVVAIASTHWYNWFFDQY